MLNKPSILDYPPNAKHIFKMKISMFFVISLMVNPHRASAATLALLLQLEYFVMLENGGVDFQAAREHHMYTMD